MGDKEDEKKVFVKVIIEESTEQIDIFNYSICFCLPLETYYILLSSITIGDYMFHLLYSFYTSITVTKKKNNTKTTIKDLSIAYLYDLYKYETTRYT